MFVWYSCIIQAPAIKIPVCVIKTREIAWLITCDYLPFMELCDEHVPLLIIQIKVVCPSRRHSGTILEEIEYFPL